MQDPLFLKSFLINEIYKSFQVIKQNAKSIDNGTYHIGINYPDRKYSTLVLTDSDILITNKESEIEDVCHIEDIHISSIFSILNKVFIESNKATHNVTYNLWLNSLLSKLKKEMLREIELTFSIFLNKPAGMYKLDIATELGVLEQVKYEKDMYGKINLVIYYRFNEAKKYVKLDFKSVYGAVHKKDIIEVIAFS